MTTRKFSTFSVYDATPTDHLGRRGEITYRDGFLYYHDGVTPGGALIGGGGSGGPTSWSSVTGKPSFAAVATSGSYADLTGKPTIPTDVSDLTDTTSLLGGGTPTMISSGNTAPGSAVQANETNVSINFSDGGSGQFVFKANGQLQLKAGGDIVDSTGTSLLGGGFSGAYADLTGKPTIPTDVSDLTDTTSLLFSGSYSDLSNTPALFSGSYTDLTSKPTIPTSFSSLVNGANTVSLGTDGTLTLPSGGAVDGNFVNGQWLDVWLTAPEGATKTAGVRDFFGKTVAYVNEDSFIIQTNRAVSTRSWIFGEDGDLTAPGNIILNNPVTTVTESVTGTVADSNGNPFTFRILKADNPQLITPFADPNFVLKWTGTDAGSVAAGTQAPGGQGPSSLVSDDGTYWNFNSWFGLNTSRPNTGTVFTVEYGVVHSDTMISTTATNLVIEADTEQWKFGTDGVLTLPDNSVIASYKPVTVIAGPTGVQTISDNASATRLTFIESVDSVGAFTDSTFTVPYTGYYQFNATVYFTSDVTLTNGFLVILNTTSGLNELDTLYYGAHTGRVINGSSMQYLTAGDTVALFFRQVSGNGVDIGSSSRLTIHRVSIS